MPEMERMPGLTVEQLVSYREGFADALRWVLEHEPGAAEIEEILDGDENGVLPGSRTS